MSEPIESPLPAGESPPVDGAEPLQFEQAEFAASPPERLTCTVCHQPIPEEYYEINGKVMCPRCRHGVEAAFRGGSAAARFIQAILFGVTAAAAGAILYYASIRLTNFNLALVSIFVGYLVGKAVRKGTGNRGGAFYQLLAVFLTYSSIVAMHVLLDIQEESLSALIESMVENFQTPLKKGLESPITGLIYAFALWEAWKINTPLNLVFNGPFRLGVAGQPAEIIKGEDDGS